MQFLLIRTVTLLIALCGFTSAWSQVPADFEVNPATKLQISSALTSSCEGLVFRWPAAQPAPLKFSIGSYNTRSSSSNLMPDMKLTAKRNKSIYSILQKRKVTAYAGRKNADIKPQRYELDVTLIGYGNTIRTKGEAFRFYSATYTTAKRANAAPKPTLLSDTTFLAGEVKLPDSSTWTLDLKYQQTIHARHISGELTQGKIKYQLKEQLTDRNNEKLEHPGLLFYQDNVLIGAADFPKMYGSLGIILFTPALPIPTRQAFIGAASLLFAYRGTLQNR